MNPPPDLWPTIRAALETTSAKHWSTLRRIAPLADPRLTAAETVASAALALIQEPATWTAAQLILSAEDSAPGEASMIRLAAGLDDGDLRRALRRLEALDIATRLWAEQAYPPGSGA